MGRQPSKYDNLFELEIEGSSRYARCLICKSNGKKKILKLGHGTKGLLSLSEDSPKYILESNSKPLTALQISAARYCVRNALSFNSFDSKQYKDMIEAAKVCSKEEKPPTSYMVKKGVSDMFVNFQNAVQKDLTNTDYCTISCDHWSDCNTQSTLGIVAHYINEKFEYKSLCVDFDVVESHTAEHTTNLLVNLANDLVIKNKIVQVVGDTTSSMMYIYH